MIAKENTKYIWIALISPHTYTLIAGAFLGFNMGFKSKSKCKKNKPLIDTIVSIHSSPKQTRPMQTKNPAHTYIMQSTIKHFLAKRKINTISLSCMLLCNRVSVIVLPTCHRFLKRSVRIFKCFEFVYARTKSLFNQQLTTLLNKFHPSQKYTSKMTNETIIKTNKNHWQIVQYFIIKNETR